LWCSTRRGEFLYSKRCKQAYIDGSLKGRFTHYPHHSSCSLLHCSCPLLCSPTLLDQLQPSNSLPAQSTPQATTNPSHCYSIPTFKTWFAIGHALQVFSPVYSNHSCPRLYDLTQWAVLHQPNARQSSAKGTAATSRSTVPQVAYTAQAASSEISKTLTAATEQ
jgi:hypothetical protein